MSRYIDAELFDKNLMIEIYLAEDEDFTKAFVRGMEFVKKAEDETPTADVQEVKHGKWDEIRDGYGKLEGWIHRGCGRMSMGKDNYCPKCGARMDLEDGVK